MTEHVIETAEQLRSSYGEPSERAARKSLDRLDRHCRRFIELSPFVVLASAGADGRVDCSPRGDPAGFVAVLDDRTVLLPDRLGNNRVDSLRNVLESPYVGLLFMMEEIRAPSGRDPSAQRPGGADDRPGPATPPVHSPPPVIRLEDASSSSAHQPSCRRHSDAAQRSFTRGRGGGDCFLQCTKALVRSRAVGTLLVAVTTAWVSDENRRTYGQSRRERSGRTLRFSRLRNWETMKWWCSGRNMTVASNGHRRSSSTWTSTVSRTTTPCRARTCPRSNEMTSFEVISSISWTALRPPTCPSAEPPTTSEGYEPPNGATMPRSWPKTPPSTAASSP